MNNQILRIKTVPISSISSFEMNPIRVINLTNDFEPFVEDEQASYVMRLTTGINLGPKRKGLKQQQILWSGW